MADDKNEKIVKSDDEWREQLTPAQYMVARRGGTEPPYSGDYNDEKRAGTYACACCGAPLFSSQDKFESGSGWPSYTRPVDAKAVEERADHSHMMARTEVVCAKCDAHLGHVFPDGPAPTGLRYCINSLSLNLEPEE